MQFASERLGVDVLTVGVIIECDGSEVHLSQGGASGLEAFSKVNEVAEGALRCPGFLRCHSSILNFKNHPGMSEDMNKPVGRVIFPSKLRLHLPSRIYSTALGHCPIKWFG